MKDGMDRRSMLKVAGGTVGAGMVAMSPGCLHPPKKPEHSGRCGCGGKKLAFNNADFYDAAGKFQLDKAKDAYIALMKYHHYPVYKDMTEKLWASDYGTGQFTKLGLAARMWMNNETDRYMLMDLYLLPNQMLPEHWHLEGEKNPAKLEGWLVRYGLSHIVGEGTANLSKDVVIPACHMGGKATTMHEEVAGPGDFVSLVRVKSRHWQFAGPEGAIITEVANVHTGPAVRHSDKAINDNFLSS